MLKIALIDANTRASKKYAGITASIVGGWLEWEFEQIGINPSPQNEADIIFLVFAGAMDYLANCRKYLRVYGVEPDARKRGNSPYVITGGPIDSSPFEAIQISDAFTVGEGYRFVRELLKLIKLGKSLQGIRDFIIEYPYAIERSQIENLARDNQKPWLLADVSQKIASPDPYVDWAGVPPVRGDDKVVRLIGSKGCHCKCVFCATTYRQTYKTNPNDNLIIRQSVHLSEQGERVQILSNDPANLKFWNKIQTRLDSQSFTIFEMRQRETRANLIKNKVGIARFGVEGVSERIRKAFGKPIQSSELLDITAELHANKINTRWFMIMGAPYETEGDWLDFRELHYKLARALDWGICQIKFTAFVPNPPAPLVRFIPSFKYNRYLKNHIDWVLDNAVSRHVMCYYGNKEKSQIRAIAEQLVIPIDIVEKLTLLADRDNIPFDLFKTLEDAYRATWEVIEWPISTELRWRMGSIYRDKMTGISHHSTGIHNPV